MPIAILDHIDFDPPLPDAKRRVIDSIEMDSVIKSQTLYDRAYWRLSGHVEPVSGADKDVDAMTGPPVTMCFDDTTVDGRLPCLVGLTLGERANQLGERRRDDRQKILVSWKLLDWVYRMLAIINSRRQLGRYIMLALSIAEL